MGRCTQTRAADCLKRRRNWIGAFALGLIASSQTCYAEQTFTVLFAYTWDVAQHTPDIDLAVQHMVDVSNLVYRNSRTDIVMQSVGVLGFPDYREAVSASGKTSEDCIADHSAFMGEFDGVMDDVHRERDSRQANICILLTHTWPPTGGVGYTDDRALTMNPEYAFACVDHSLAGALGYLTLAHEVGHIFGCRHQFVIRSYDPPYAFAFGLQGSYFAPYMGYPDIYFDTDLCFLTLMGTHAGFIAPGGRPCIIPYLSSPDLVYVDPSTGLPYEDGQGRLVPLGSAAYRDCRRVHIERVSYIQGYVKPAVSIVASMHTARGY